MTPTELREVDERVARLVMVLPEVEFVGERLQYRNEQMAEEYGGRWSSPVPLYSTDTNAAFTLIERMQEMGWEVSAYTHERLWIVTFTPNPFQNNHTNYNAHALLLPEAICKAALSAIEEGK